MNKKDTEKQVFFRKRLKIKQNTAKIGADFWMKFASRFQSEKG